MPACTICADPGLRKVIDGNLDEKVSFAGISRSMAGWGATVAVEVISRHSKHYQPEATRAPGTRKRDFAVMVRDSAADMFERDLLLLADKDHVPGINAGLKAQVVLDKREQVAKKQTQADVLLSLLAALRGEGRPILQIDDGLTVEGNFVETD